MSEVIAEAYEKMREIIMLPKSKTSMEILQEWYTEEDVNVLTAGPFKIVQMDRYTIEDYAEESGLPIEKVKETFERLSPKGLLFWYFDRKDGNKKKYMIPPLFPGLVEYYIISPNNSIDARRKFVKKFHALENDGLMMGVVSDFSVFRVVPGTKPEPTSRLIEVNESLEVDKQQVLAYNDVEEIIRQAGKHENNIAILPCTCRTMTMMLKEQPQCEASIENCMVFGSSSAFCVEEGIGRYVSADECLDILKETEKEGLIHLTLNTYEKQSFICNCCACCCGIISTAVRLNFMDLFQNSDYVPVIDNDECSKCRKCIGFCKFNALVYKFGNTDDKSDDTIMVREDVCIGCGVCSSNCPKDAINLKKISDNKPADSFMDAVMRMMTGRKI